MDLGQCPGQYPYQYPDQNPVDYSGQYSGQYPVSIQVRLQGPDSGSGEGRQETFWIMGGEKVNSAAPFSGVKTEGDREGRERERERLREREMGGRTHGQRSERLSGLASLGLHVPRLACPRCQVFSPGAAARAVVACSLLTLCGLDLAAPQVLSRCQTTVRNRAARVLQKMSGFRRFCTKGCASQEQTDKLRRTNAHAHAHAHAHTHARTRTHTDTHTHSHTHTHTTQTRSLQYVPSILCCSACFSDCGSISVKCQRDLSNVTFTVQELIQGIQELVQELIQG